MDDPGDGGARHHGGRQAVLEPGRSRAIALASTVVSLVLPARTGRAWYFGRRQESSGDGRSNPSRLFPELGHDRRP